MGRREGGEVDRARLPNAATSNIPFAGAGDDMGCAPAAADAPASRRLTLARRQERRAAMS
jgi:hypothetical protein